MSNKRSVSLKHHGPVWVLCLCILLAGCSSSSDDGVRYQSVELGGQTFELEIADTKATRHQGLSGREAIAADGGMLFVFPFERDLTFVMRDCLVPIDIAFVAPGGRVLATHAMRVEPLETRGAPKTYYASHGKALFAIEVAGGTLQRLGVKPGDRVELPEVSLKAAAR